MISIAVILVLVIVVAMVFGFGMNWLWLRGGADKPRSAMPGCGRCGYPVHSITSFECPECGADLREVGIHRPGEGQGHGAIVVALIAGSIAFFILCGMVSEVIDDYLPAYGSANARISLSPAHGNYAARVRLETSETLWGNSYSNGMGFNLRSYSNSSSNPIQITLDGFKPEMQIDALSLVIEPNSVSPSASYRPVLEVDPGTAVATWQGLDGKPHQTNGPFTDQDMLRFLGASGMDQKQPQTLADAQQLYLFLDGLTQRKTQFTMVGFDSFSSGGGSSYGGGRPDWIWPLYTVFCILFWIVAITLILRRYNRRRVTQTNS